MSECIRGSYDDALYKLAYTTLYFTCPFFIFQWTADAVDRLTPVPLQKIVMTKYT